MKLRIFNCPWHLGNQYELYKLAQKYDVEFYLLENNVRRFNRYAHRPVINMPGINWVTHYEKGKYDLALLHLDQQCIDPEIGKGQLYRQLNEVIQDIPKIVINHGTPMWDEQFTEDIVINGGEFIGKSGNPKRLEGMKQLIGDNFMIVNSYEAVNRWGWGYPIIHGMDPDEWWDLPKEPRVILSLSTGGLDKYYNRALITYIRARLKDLTGLNLIHTNIDVKIKDWDDYRELIGSSLINISPFRDSPMPRGRTEGMLSGACVLTSKYHGADEFIEQGVNGFIVPENPQSYAEAIYQLINHNYGEAVEIGQRAKETAKRLFHIDRYLEDVYKVFIKVANGNKPEWSGEKIWEKSYAS